MNAVSNRYAGECRHCWQHIPAGQGEAVRNTASDRWEVRHPSAPDGCPPNPHDPGGAPLIEIGQGEGYGGSGWRPGRVFRAEWRSSLTPEGVAFPGHTRDGDFESGIAVVVAATSEYYADEGMSFGVGAEQGRYYRARIRAASDAEAAPVLARERAAAHRRDLTARTRLLFSWRYAGPNGDAERPPADQTGHLSTLPEVPVRPHGRHAPAHADRLLIDETAVAAWTLVYNGADGDDWSANNHGAWVALRHPLTEARHRLIADLRAEYDDADPAYVNAGIRQHAVADIAPVLRELGVPASRVADARSLWVETVEDAAAFAARTPGQWRDAGWDRITSRRYLAADAARLADAGITCSRAGKLHDAGFATVEEMLSAHPPHVGDDTARIIMVNGSGTRDAQVTDDPRVARQWLDRHPSYWGDVRFVTGPVRCVHVSGNAVGWLGNYGASPDRPWQLWDDGSASLGGWLRPVPRGEDYAPPRSLSGAAETALTLLFSGWQSGNGPLEREFWHPLREATAHTATTVAEDGRSRASSGEEWMLVRHDFALPSGAVTLWQVLTESWAMGEEGDFWRSYTTHPSERAARAAYDTARQASGSLR